MSGSHAANKIHTKREPDTIEGPRPTPYSCATFPSGWAARGGFQREACHLAHCPTLCRDLETHTKDIPEYAANAHRGIRKLPPRLGRPSPYGVQWSEKTWDPISGIMRRKTPTEFFKTEEDRDKRFNNLVSARKSGSPATATRQEITDWRAFQVATAGTPWQDVVAGWRNNLRDLGQSHSPILVQAAADEYLARYQKRVDNHQAAMISYKKAKRQVERFATGFGSQRIDSISGETIEDWLDDLDDVEAEATFNSYRRGLHAFFERSVDRGILRRNPAGDIALRDELTESGLLSVDETAKLMHTARNYQDPRYGWRYRRILGRIALECFAGLRTSAARRVEKADINFEDRGITLPKRKAKMKRRHYVSGLPHVLWAWLKLAPPEAWHAIDSREYRYLKSELFSAAGVPHPKNCLRHGFASYLLAALKDAGRVAYFLSHRNVDELMDHYAGRVTQRDAAEWIQLTPQRAAKLAAKYRPRIAAEPDAAEDSALPRATP